MNQSSLNLPPLPIGQRWIIEEDDYWEYKSIVVRLEESCIVTTFERTGWFGKKEEKTTTNWVRLNSIIINSYTSDNLVMQIEKQAKNILKSNEDSTKLKGIVERVKGVYEPVKI
jgi:hypothetical protein